MTMTTSKHLTFGHTSFPLTVRNAFTAQAKRKGFRLRFSARLALHGAVHKFKILLLPADTRRSFVVTQVAKASGSHRPSFTFLGSVVEHQGGPGSQTERGLTSGSMSSRSSHRGPQTARGGRTQRSRLVVIASDLTLDITYEPPRPKFSKHSPGSCSYRLKLSSGKDFLYSVRGLPDRLDVDQTNNRVQWGPLELQYNSKQQLNMFARAVKHVMLDWQPVSQQAAKPVALTSQSLASNVASSQFPVKAAEEQSCFGSPLPSPLQSPVIARNKQTASLPPEEHSVADKQDVPASTHSGRPLANSGAASALEAFVSDNWVWIGLGVGAVSLVSWALFRSHTSATSVSPAAHKYQLHIV